MSKSLGNTVAPEEVVKQYGADILRLWVAQCDYTADLRIGPEILKGVADGYRRLRNTMRFMLGSLAHHDAERDQVAPADMPELERWVLHRLAELDAKVREGYAAYDFQGVFKALFNFCTVDLSSFYFDIRKDALYCDGDTERRRAALCTLDLLHRRLVPWLAQSWSSPWRMSGCTAFRATPNRCIWKISRKPRRVARRRTRPEMGGGAPGAPRGHRSAGGAARGQADRLLARGRPVVHVADAAVREALGSAQFEDVCITSGIVVGDGEGPGDAFRLPEVDGVAVVHRMAEGGKCARCWKVLPDVGSHESAGTCGRCDAHLHEGT